MIKRVRDRLAEVPDKEFDMDNWLSRPAWLARADDEITSLYGRHCGTAACIAGWACILNPICQIDGEDVVVQGAPWEVEYRARDLLDLDKAMADQLFKPSLTFGTGVAFNSDITRDWAVRCLDKLIETGAVDWPGTRHAP